jgi:hypothetical protein
MNIHRLLSRKRDEELRLRERLVWYLHGSLGNQPVFA